MQCVSHEMRLLSYSAELGYFIFKTGGLNKQTTFSSPHLHPIKWLRNRNADVGRKDSYRWVIVFMSSWARICCYAAFTHIINLYCLPALYIELYSRAIGGMKKKKNHVISPQNRISRSFHLLSATCCRLFPCWNVRKKELSLKEKEKKKENWVASAALWIITAPLITHPRALCARLRLGWRRWLLPLHQCGRTAWSSGLPIDWDWHSGSGWLPPWGQYWHAGSGLDNRVAGLRLSSFD